MTLCFSLLVAAKLRKGGKINGEPSSYKLVVVSPYSINDSAVPIFMKIKMKIKYLSSCALFSPLSNSKLSYRRVKKLHKFRSNGYLETISNIYFLPKYAL